MEQWQAGWECEGAAADRQVFETFCDGELERECTDECRRAIQDERRAAARLGRHLPARLTH